MSKNKKTKLELLLNILSDFEWHWNDELASKVSWRFGATIKEARDKGHQIETDHDGRKWRYRLIPA
ncbi:hypothetical protein N836_20075 [Leptolyngbya sp. Heron Island J]|uniref:hypothetical protein n=1 Tax=Leptolyngbya sp. Heron Island J TaxID=1385935 RepID=UPI0003B9B46C|nr:hypothetical protein [Leptolyngbya sp. Heron Island J]ESA33786.1 hypothetical protein N836_20075 [Leptolyngbya sp. Heron Island J]